jgi:hypothetical protein
MRSPLLWIALLIAGALFGACSQNIQPVLNDGTVTNALDYFWTNADLAKGLDYSLLQNKTTATHHISSTDGIEIHDATLNSMALVVHSNRDTVLVDSVGASSIFSLPAGYFFASKTISAGVPFGVNAILVNGQRIVAATDSGIYFSDNESEWVRASTIRATVLAQDSELNCYAAVGDRIYQSSDKGEAWALIGRPHPGIDITAIQCLSNGVVYLGYRMKFGVERVLVAQSTLTKPQILISTDSIRAIAVSKVDTNEQVVVAGTHWTLSIRNNRVLDSQFVYHTNALLFANGLFYAGCDNGATYVEAFGDSGWASLEGRQNSIVSLVWTGSNKVAAITDGGSILTYRSLQMTPIGSAGLNPRCACLRGTQVLIGTSAGIVPFDLPGNHFNTAIGPQDTQDSIGGLLLLLRSKLAANGSWPAGVVHGPGLGKGMAITGRVMDHPDRLDIDSTDGRVAQHFGEAFQIRYAAELPDGTMSLSLPLYLLVYYVKGTGPVLIEEYLGNTFQERAELIR